MLRDAARDICNERLAPFTAQWDCEGKSPQKAVGQLGELDLCDMPVPPEWGGSYSDYVAYAPKKLIHQARNGAQRESALAVERLRFVALFDRPDQRESVNAFLQELRPNWSLSDSKETAT